MTMLLYGKLNPCTWRQHTMMIALYLTISAFLFVKCVAEDLASAPSDSQTKDLLIRGAKPIKHDAYLCSAYPVTDLEAYIYKFEAVANASTAHHILLHGCDGEPFSNEPIWNCHALCKSGRTTILFAWAKNAPPTVLPKGVGLKIGQQTSIRTIVLQVHYAKSFDADEPSDHSGVRIYTTVQKQPYVAGIYLLASNAFVVPPGLPAYPVDISCRFNKEKSIFPIFYRPHTHSLGTVVTGYQYNDSYHEIGKGNPQYPQAFYPVKDRIEVQQGDYLAARCTYNSTSMDVSIHVGSTSKDEMCNFYIMFYTDNSVEDPYGECRWNSYPEITGSNFPPDVSATLLPNPALEEEAMGHHHHEDKGGAASSGQDGQALRTQIVDKNETDIPGVIAQNVKDKTIQSKLSAPGSQKHGIEFKNGVDFEASTPGKSLEMLQYDYDFDDLGSMGRAYEKRLQQSQHEYYDEYAANDLRDKGLFDPSPGGTAEQGLSRNRNKEFETMNQQLQNFPHKKQPYRQPHQHSSNSAGDVGGSSDPRIPVESGAPVMNTNQAGVDARAGEVVKAQSQIHFERSLEYNASWPVQKIELGQVGGVATDNDGNVYIFHRASRKLTERLFSLDNDFLFQDSPIPEDVIVVLDSQGRLLRKFGAGQYFLPHGITVDKSGNIWLTDVAMHQVFKIPRGETKPSLILGQKFKHGKDETVFCQPTDVAVLSSGEFYVSDGYCNGRVLKFSKEGTVISTWGERKVITGSSPPAGTFDIPHSITVSEENQLVCVADMDNGRVQCFDLDGNFKHFIKLPEFGQKVLAIENCPLHGGVLYAVNGPVYSGPHDFSVQGFTLDIKTGQLLEVWNLPQQLKNPHDICVHPASQSVYVGEFVPQAVWKLSRASRAGKKADLTQKHEGTLGDTKLNGTTTSVGTSDVKPSPTAASNDTSHGVSGNTNIDDDDEDITPSVIIGLLLVVPVILLLIITLLVRAHKSGKLKCYHRRKNRVFSLQGILGNSHKGFDALSTEDSDHDIDQEDSDRDEFLTPKKIKNKT